MSIFPTDLEDRLSAARAVLADVTHHDDATVHAAALDLFLSPEADDRKAAQRWLDLVGAEA